MGWEAIAIIVAALIGYFSSKKAGASDGEAAAIAAAAGAGAYYVTTKTEWGKSSIKWLDTNWNKLVSNGEVTVTGPDGNPMKLPEGSELVRNADGEIMTDANGVPLVKVKTPDGKGGWFQTITSVTGDVLKTWGGNGTAAVIGAGQLPKIIDKINDNPMPWILGGALLLVLVLR